MPRWERVPFSRAGFKYIWLWEEKFDWVNTFTPEPNSVGKIHPVTSVKASYEVFLFSFWYEYRYGKGGHYGFTRVLRKWQTILKANISKSLQVGCQLYSFCIFLWTIALLDWLQAIAGLTWAETSMEGWSSNGFYRGSIILFWRKKGNPKAGIRAKKEGKHIKISWTIFLYDIETRTIKKGK